MPINKGERFKQKGYDVVATMSAAHGGGPPDRQWLLLLNNNSSHYLLCWAVYPDSEKVELESSYEYMEAGAKGTFDEDVAILRVYQHAIEHMTKLAMRY